MKVTRVVAPIRTQAVEAIRHEIITGAFKPGQRLVERELCEELDVSRNTIREACRQLEAEGFIEIPPHKGPVVATISDQDARDLYEFREALECLAVKLFVERADDACLTELDDAAQELFSAHDADDVAAMLTAKDRFYAVLYTGAGNQVIANQATILTGRLASLRARSLSHRGRPARSKREINGVLRKIRARKPDEAAELWRAHIANAAATALGS